MKIYIKNTDTNEILALEAKSYESLSKNFRKFPYQQASDSEANAKELELKKAEKIDQCQAYLNSTDKWSIRLSETSVAMPSGVAANRANARAYQSQIKACTTLEQLNNINTDF
tara:strand:+ start:54 stop:392 length:339 start_codon:yes stop_codon:yes gene_type:complete